MTTCCKDCGRKISTSAKWGRCLICHNKKVRARFEPKAVPIHEPPDAELEMINDGLIAQRKRALLPENICCTEDPAEERMIRARLGLT
jgi:hypothetical protein